MSSPSIWPIFRLAFRPFFFFGTLFSCFAMIVWLLVINGVWTPTLYGGGLFWHIHEMIFGFVAAIMVGFLLTAVKNWTGQPGWNGWVLVLLVALWGIPRIGFLIAPLHQWVLMQKIFIVIDIAFLLSAAVFLAIPIVKVRQWRNIGFVPILIVLAFCNGMMHVGFYQQTHEWMMQGAYSAIHLIALMITILAGRVIPFFTANGTATTKVTPLKTIEVIVIAQNMALFLVYLFGVTTYFTPSELGVFAICMALVHGVRWARWRFWMTLGSPLLWSLHCAYAFLILFYFQFGFDLLTKQAIQSTTWHLLTYGVMGSLILSMVVRVSLGHTGRAIAAPLWMVPALLAVLLGALVRSLVVAAFPEYYLVLVNLSGVVWAIAFFIFVIGFLFILFTSRIDNKFG